MLLPLAGPAEALRAKRPIAWRALFPLLLTLAAVPFPAAAISILSGSSWSSTATDPGGLAWTQPGFDDGAWIAAYDRYLVRNTDDFIPGTSAEFMWYWNEPTAPTEVDGPLEAWFRYEFELAPTDFPAVGRGAIVADDYFALYVNGHFVADGFLEPRFSGYPVDFGQWLVPGDNVLAIYAFDGFPSGPADRGAEGVLFGASVHPVPEPLSLLLVGSGLTAIGLARRRRRARSLPSHGGFRVRPMNARRSPR